MITITGRPEKTLSSGYVSKWNSSRLPLIYKLSNDRFPVNTFDTPSQTLEVGPYDSSEKGMRFTTSTADKYNVGDWIKIENFPLEGVYKIKKKETSNLYFLDLYDEGTYSTVDYPTMTDNQYYKGYKGLVKVFAGAPEYHPYNTDGSKPQREIGVIEVDFDASNEGIANVRQFIKPDMSAAFDTVAGFPGAYYRNSHFAWTSFAIEYAEIWDASTTPTYVEDTLDNCTAFNGFVDPEFLNGLTDWETVSQGIGWTGQVGTITANGNIGNSETDWVGQDLQLRAGVEYEATIIYNITTGTQSDNFFLSLFDENNNALLQRFNLVAESGSQTITQKITPIADTSKVYFQVSRGASTTAFSFVLDALQITSEVADPCKYSSFSIFGAKQFQDPLGGNFGDYIASVETQGKFLTHFQELTYPFYINSIIPNATFTRSEGADSVYLDVKALDIAGNIVEETRQKIGNASDGVYTTEASLTVGSKDWKTGTAQLVSIPSNLLLDGDGGTFEDTNTANWNISIVNAISTGMTSATAGPSGNYGLYNINFSPLSVGEYVLYQYDTPIQTIAGEAYTLNADGLTMNNFSSSLIENKAKFFYRIKGTNFVSNKFEFVNERPETATFQLDFEATSSSHQIEVVLEINETSLNGGGFALGVDNVTFKGPIEYLTEVKTIKPSSSCSVKYNTPLRWKNDLGGWEQWNFNRYRTYNESVSNRNEIRRDVTQNFDDYFINGDSEYDTINMDVRKSVTLRSGLLTENEQVVLNQIRRSIKIQIELNGVWTTVTANPSTYLLTDEVEDMREVSFDVYLPNTLVQEQ